MHKVEKINDIIRQISFLIKKYNPSAPMPRKNKDTETMLLNIKKKSIKTVIKYVRQTVMKK